MITIPPDFAHDTITREGDAGRDWLAQLPQQVEHLCIQWKLTLDGPVLHGYVGIAVPVRRGEEECILKVSWLDASSKDEPVALCAWNGMGAVKLLDYEPNAHALLLERLDHTRTLNGLPVGDAISIAGRLLRRLAIPAPAKLITIAEYYADISQVLSYRWETYNRPMSRALVDRVSTLALELGASGARLLVNYDLHYLDVLAGSREPWLAVDPKVVAGMPEFGVAQLLWCRLDEMVAQRGLAYYFSLLIETAELDPHLARAWTLVRCIDYWLWGLTVGLTDDPARCAMIVKWIEGNRGT